MDAVRQFSRLFMGVWQHGLYGIDIGKLLIAILIFFIFVLVRRLFNRFVFCRIEKFAQKTKIAFDDEFVSAIEKPLGFIPIILGLFFSFEYLDLKGGFEAFIERVIRSLIVFTIFWILVKIVKPLSFLLKKLENIFTPSMIDWLIKTISATFIFIGAATILEIWGIKVGPIIAGLGLFGVAVALGAQDLFKNLISGILIIAERRFQIGDWIKVDGVVEGTVESIGFRSTRIRRFDKAPVFVPNAKLSDNAVTNFSDMTHRRIYWKIGLEYRTTIDQLRQIRDDIEYFLTSSREIVQPPKVPLFVRVDRFNDSSIDLMVYCFTKTIKWGEWLAIKETLAFRIMEIVEAAEAGFAFPSQSLYLEALPADIPEIFIPPNKNNEH